MERYVSLFALSLLSLGFMQSKTFDIEVKDSSNHTCIHASLMVNFTVQYEVNSTFSKNSTFSAPSNVTINGSHCGENSGSPLLLVNFGNGHSWSLNFTKNSTMYSGDILNFTYNTNDSTFFPDALKQGLKSSLTKFLDPVLLNRTYKCMHNEILRSENVIQLIWNVTLQAYVQNDTLGQEITCDADKPVVPTPTPPAPTPKPVDKPSVGNYVVSDDTGKCLLASLALQVNASLTIEGKNVSVLYNLNPNTTSSTGTCGNDTATLRLNDTKVAIEFDFAIKKNNFYLQEVNLTLENEFGALSGAIQNQSFWEASVGSSYLCHKEQVISVSGNLHINMFDVRVQPFGVHNGTYATAEDCFVDQDFTVPIVVGAALGALIIIVTVAYFIGRKRRQSAGYEHFS
ncbi:lysosome-associated membrane glyco 2 isoform X4 [Pelobates cultripes]|uniref:Lysosome-associated membrane glyco 2 isoform X4 n=1 Tax=Pelobates cultripes TaxID=61616 RepID=A0AAD1WNL7_PELCU|nr:lysosome-associated membrane glyco 2 isoform X4 [Pelobates cultripes]